MRPTATIGVGPRSLRRLFRDWAADCRGIAATEFAFIVPLMLVLFFGTVEFCSAIAIDRKVSLTARTLSDLTSQSISIADSDTAAFFLVASKIIWPYPETQPNPYFASPVSGTISELWVNPSTHKAVVQWSKGTAARTPGTLVTTVPTALLVDGAHLVFSEVSYTYTPTVGYVMKSAVTLSDVAYTRPRQSDCVQYAVIYTSCS
jgi:Flp pilus assembly protein TadG